MDARLLDLTELDPGQSDVYGGKACGLARLVRAGARVPACFVVPATLTPPQDWGDAQRNEFMRRAQALHSQGPLAVRSSATLEDSAQKSFAGLFDTVLGVSDQESLWSAAARCIASGGAERVRAYAGSTAPLPVGLVVQVEVTPRASGVCFTADPTGKDRAVTVEAVVGKGEALVSGRAQPEAWRIYRSGLGGWEALKSPNSPSTVLPEEDARRIASEAATFESHFGHPLDLEWALDGAGVLWWLQARPITAAASPRTWDIDRYFTLVDDGPVTVWANWNVREVMPDPLTPLNWSLWREAILPVVIEDAFGVRRSSPVFAYVAGIDLVHGRLYWNMNGLLALPWPWGRLFVAGALKAIDARAAQITARLTAAGVLRPRRRPGGARLALGMLLNSVRLTARFSYAVRPRRALRVLEECGKRIAARPEASSMRDSELLREMGLLGEPESLGFRRAQQVLGAAFSIYAVATHAFRHHPEAARLLAAGSEVTPTTQISLGVDELVEAARPISSLFNQGLSTAELLTRLETEPEGAAWLTRLSGFLARYGQRCPKEFEISIPRWAEDPTMILDLVRAGLAGSGERVTDRLRRVAERRQRAVAEAVAAASWWKRPLLQVLARLVAVYMPLREAPKHYAMFVFQRMRQAALELGSRLAARGAIDARDDVMFLERHEIESLLRDEGHPTDPRGLVGERRTRHLRHLREKAPDFLRSDGVPVEEEACGPATSQDGVLRGVAVSGGRASGPTRILRDPDPRAMADGDVIVVEFADPGWTPLFPRASALVMEVGGVMCHAAVVARELGIPAVFGVAGATRLLRDGQEVHVDGDLGEVSLSGGDPVSGPPLEPPLLAARE